MVAKPEGEGGLVWEGLKDEVLHLSVLADLKGPKSGATLPRYWRETTKRTETETHNSMSLPWLRLSKPYLKPETRWSRQLCSAAPGAHVPKSVCAGAGEARG